MRITILNMTSGGMSLGYKKYLENIIPRLAAHAKVTAILVGMPETIDFSNWQKDNPSVEWVRLRSTIIRIGREIDAITNKKIEQFHPDVIFIPTARFWSLNKIPVVNMVQNMAPFIDPYKQCPLIQKIRNWMRAKEACKAIQKSNRIIAVSQFVKDFLINSLNAKSHKIEVIYYGTKLFSNSQLLQKPSNIPDDLQNKFIFTAGLIYPYRGLEDIILALHRLNNSLKSLNLVIAGKIGQSMGRYYNDLNKLIEEKRLISQIRWMGILNEAEMIWCYQNCSIFAMTSRVETCPNIALEAMANGCLCISTDNPPLPEIFGNAALFYSPGKPDLLVQRIREILNWPEEKRQEMKTRAMARASEFSWDLCCKKTVYELQKAIKESKLK